ncbi:MAG: Pyrimidine 5'-nucleotidase YjjG [bacterium ADurb.Bin374]|nr:MAG: Pyrimidine 5'-nucleotidase YjjG [bacterium ADurb.Bin374]
MRHIFRGIFFDMGGTLVFPDPERISAAFSRHLKRDFPPSRCLEAVHAATIELDRRLTVPSEKPEDWWGDYFGVVADHCDPERLSSSAERLHAFEELRADHRKRNLWSWFVPGVRELLDWLESTGVVAGIISNSDGRVKAQLRAEGLLDRFRVVLDSHEVGIEKPDARIFRMALDAVRLEARDSLYIGDFTNIDGRGASRAGLSALIIDPLGKRSEWGYPTVRSLESVRNWLEAAGS